MKPKTYFAYEVSGKNLDEILKNSPSFTKDLLLIMQYITHTQRKV